MKTQRKLEVQFYVVFSHRFIYSSTFPCAASCWLRGKNIPEIHSHPEPVTYSQRTENNLYILENQSFLLSVIELPDQLPPAANTCPVCDPLTGDLIPALVQSHSYWE